KDRVPPDTSTYTPTLLLDTEPADTSVDLLLIQDNSVQSDSQHSEPEDDHQICLDDQDMTVPQTHVQFESFVCCVCIQCEITGI
ncbi:hypothetical protein M9458_055951, partial [Cirrhinus mrigala]